MPFKLNPLPFYTKKLIKLIKKDAQIKPVIVDFLEKLSDNHRNPVLGSHKVNTKKSGLCFSSKVTGDLRILWRYNDNFDLEIIYLLDIGGHSGGNKVY